MAAAHAAACDHRHHIRSRDTRARLHPTAICVLSLKDLAALTTGIAGFTKTVALETAKGGNVTCNAICPGYMLTALVQNQLEAAATIRGITKVWLDICVDSFCITCDAPTAVQLMGRHFQRLHSISCTVCS